MELVVAVIIIAAIAYLVVRRGKSESGSGDGSSNPPDSNKPQ